MKKHIFLATSFFLLTAFSSVYGYHTFKNGPYQKTNEFNSICSVLGILYGSLLAITLVMCVPSHATIDDPE